MQVQTYADLVKRWIESEIEQGLKTPNYGDENNFCRKWADDNLRGALDH